MKDETDYESLFDEDGNLPLELKRKYKQEWRDNKLV